MPSLFDEYRTLLQLLEAVIQRESDIVGTETHVTYANLNYLLDQAIEQVNEVEAEAS